MKKSRVPKSDVSSHTNDSLAAITAAVAPVIATPTSVVSAAEAGTEEKPKKDNGKRGIKEESTAKIPRARQLYAWFVQNWNDRVKKLPSNAEIGRFLDPVQPLKVD